MKTLKISKFLKNINILNRFYSTFKPPHNYTPIKINNSNEKFPSEEENIGNLLSELMNPKKENELNVSSYENYMVQKDNVLFLSNYNHDPALVNIKLGQFIIINGNYIAQCTVIKENLLAFILLSKHTLEAINEVKLLECNEKFNSELMLGQTVTLTNISNMFQNQLSHLLLKCNLTPSLGKNIPKRNLVDNILFTGNLLVDYVFPIYSGNMSVLTGGTNLGQKQILNNTAINFLNNPADNCLVVYLTYSKKEAYRMNDLISSSNLKKDFVIFTISENPSDSEHYYLPRVALNYIKESIIRNKTSHPEKKLSILLCWDDINTYVYKEKHLFEISKSYASDNIFAEIFEQTGNFDNYSLSSIIVSEKSKLNREFDNLGEKTLENIFSFSDKIIKFDCNLAMTKKYIPNLFIDFSGLPNLKLHTSYVTTHAIEMKEILQNIYASHKKFEEIKKLKIHSDPWDNYLYYDSKFMLDFIFSSNSVMAEEKFLQLKFLMFIYYNNLMANFKIDGKIVADRLIKFISNDTHCNKIYQFVRNVLFLQQNPSEEEIEKFESQIEILFDLLIDDMTVRKEISEYKEDYFRV